MPSKNLSKEVFSQTSLRDNYVHNCIEKLATNQQAYSSWNTQPVIKLDSLERLDLLSWINISGQISAGLELKIIVPRDCPQRWCELSTPAYSSQQRVIKKYPATGFYRKLLTRPSKVSSWEWNAFSEKENACIIMSAKGVVYIHCVLTLFHICSTALDVDGYIWQPRGENS